MGNLINKTCLLLFIILLLPACSNKDGKTQETEVLGAQALYEDAKRALDAGNFPRAILFYTRLQARFPFNRNSEQAQMELAYAFYRDKEPEKALSAVKRVIKTYPTHPQIDYAYYLKGLINFDRGGGVLDFLTPHDPSERDQQYALQAFHDFNDLLARFPDTSYGGDARLRMTYLRNRLARHELTVARYYLKRSAYIAAANRVRYLLENYPESPESREALQVLADAYDGLQLSELADDVRKIQSLNPDSGQINASRSIWQKIFN